MIACYEGIPGSAKTYSAVKKMAEILKTTRRKVYTNIDGLSGTERDDFIHREAFRMYCGLTEKDFYERFRPLSKEQSQTFWEIAEPGSLIVLDEIHKLWSNREWQTSKNKSFADWCSTHRHEGFDLIIITQKLEKVDAHVRSLVEWTYRYKKINYFGKMVQNSFTESVHFEDDTVSDPFKRNRYTFDKKIFKCYKSYASKDIKETGIAQYHNVLKHPIFFILPIIFILGIYMLVAKSGFLHGNAFGLQLWGTKKAEAAVPKKMDIPPCKGYWKDGKCVVDPNMQLGSEVLENTKEKKSDFSDDSQATGIVIDPDSLARVEKKGKAEYEFYAQNGRYIGFVKYVKP